MKQCGMQRGFTLLELMIAMAVLSILLVIAIPLYFNYQTRAKVAEAFAIAGSAVLSVTEMGHAGTWPSSNHEAGLASPASIVGSYVGSVSVTRPVPDEPSQITVTMSDGNTQLFGRIIILEPVQRSGSIHWRCSRSKSTVDEKFLPASCR